MPNAQLAAMMRHGITHAKANSMELVDEVLKVPASNYTSDARFKLEVDQIFKRLPLMLAPSCEIPEPNDFKTLEVAGVPLLLLRDARGEVKLFVNSCTHRGTNVATEPTGSAKRFVCPYHGWTFGQGGELIAVAAAGDFGFVDKSCLGLTALPVGERAGLIFGSLDKASTVDIDAFLGGYDELLETFGFKDWFFFSSRVLRGPNWKIAYDGYLDFYHLPVLHKNTLNANGTFGTRAHYHAWGPHQRLLAPDRNAGKVADVPEAEWKNEDLLSGVWTIFPCISIASFDGGGRGVMISQLLPGDKVGESWTRQMYLMEKRPTAEQEEAAHAQFAFLETVVKDEDYETGLRQQRALDHGTLETVMFGRNEGGAQLFHKWTDRLIAADDRELAGMFPPASEQAALQAAE